VFECSDTESVYGKQNVHRKFEIEATPFAASLNALEHSEHLKDLGLLKHLKHMQGGARVYQRGCESERQDGADGRESL